MLTDGPGLQSEYEIEKARLLPFAKRGCARLDTENSRWRIRIEQAQLDMSCPYHCLLAQAHPTGYFGYESENRLTPEQLRHNGFRIESYREDRRTRFLYQILTDIWLELIHGIPALPDVEPELSRELEFA
ncbi:MAG: hypothetical protein JWL82_54 [Parcubacteria group bacterium]|nr:hypothetical protein [Parcubacteria group bacterium]